MNLILSIILILVIIIIYIVMIQVFTVLFRITGLTKEKARFQVISLLTNSGYTTSESEIITNNRRRRNIATSCMITGTIFNVLIVSLIINILFNLKTDITESYIIMLIAFLVFIAILILMRLKVVRIGIERMIEAIANRLDHSNREENVITVLDIYGKNAICEVHINRLPDFMLDKGLKDCHLKSKYSLNVMLVKRGNRIIEVNADTIISKGDSVIIFGSTQNIRDIFSFTTKKAHEAIDDTKQNIITLIDNYGEVGMATVKINRLPKEMEGRSLSESSLKDKYSLNVLMVKRNENPILVSADTEIILNDEVTIFGPYKNIKRLFLEE